MLRGGRSSVLGALYECVCRQLAARCGVLGLLMAAWILAVARAQQHYRNDNDGMTWRHFQGLENIVEVECSGETLDSNTDLLTISLFSPTQDQVLASANLKRKECTTSHSFSLCIIDSNARTRVKTLVLDLRLNESRQYGCNLTVEVDGRTSIISWSETVTRHKISVTTIAVFSSTTVASSSVYKAATPAVSGSTHGSTGVDIPAGLLVTGLVFLICFMVLSLVLLVLHFKERRRRHYLSDEYDTPLPIKGIESPAPAPSTSRGLGEKERILSAATRSPRPSTSSSPRPGLRKASGTGSGGGGSVRYQQAGMLIPHTVHGDHESVHYLSGMSVYYAEPWSGVDSESRERLRPSSRGTSHSSHESKGGSHIGHDSKGGPLPSSAPPADDNA